MDGYVALCSPNGYEGTQRSKDHCWHWPIKRFVYRSRTGSDFRHVINGHMDERTFAGTRVHDGHIHQDNKSTIAMANRGISNSPRIRHVAIRYFFVKVSTDSGEVVIEHMGTENMLADGVTKPLQGKLFRAMRRRVMGM